MSIKKFGAALAAAVVLSNVMPVTGIIEPTTAMARDFHGGGYNEPQHEGEYDSNGLYIEDGVLVETDYGLKNVVVPEGVTKIAPLALAYSGLTSITIPASVTEMNSYSFMECPNLEKIVLDPDNPSFTLVGGVLFNKERTELIVYPAKKTGTSYTVPNSVTEIGVAFQYCINLKKITIPEGISSIVYNAFYMCESLQSMTLPDSVTEIGDRAFAGCHSLTELTIPAGVNEIPEYVDSWCPNLKTIIGYAGSCAEAFAEDEGLEFISLDEPDTSIKKYAVTLNHEGIPSQEVYSVIRCNKTTAVEGETVTITLFNSEYKLKSLTVTDKNGKAIPTSYAGTNDHYDTKYTFTMPNGKVNIKAVFGSKYSTQCSIFITSEEEGGVELLPGTASAEVDNYYAMPDDIVTVTINDHLFYNFVKLVFTDESGNEIALSVTNNNDGTYSFAMPECDINIKAVFESRAVGGGPFYDEGRTIILMSYDENGRELIPETASADISTSLAMPNEIVTVTIRKHAFYDFVKFVFTDENRNEIALSVTDNYDGTYSFVMPDCDIGVRAIFAARETGGSNDGTYNIKKPSSVNGGTISFTVNGKNVTEANAGDSVKIVAKPNSGYEIRRIIVRDYDGNIIGVGDIRTFIMPDSDVFVSVSFNKVNTEPDIGSVNEEISYVISSSKVGDTITVNGGDYFLSEVISAAYYKKIKLEVKLDSTFTWKIETAKLEKFNTELDLSIFAEEVDRKAASRIEKSAGIIDNVDMSFSTAADNLGKGGALTVKTSEKGTASKPKFANLYKTAADGALEFSAAAPISFDGSTTLPIGEAAVYTIVTSSETKKPGDINNDCKVDLTDITAMLKKYVNNTGITAKDEFKMDYDNNGQCGLSDILFLLNDYVNGNV